MSMRIVTAAAVALLALGACKDKDTPVDPPDTSVPIDTGTSDNVHDPLSMPESPTLSVDSFNSADTCQSCHPDHYDQWRLSNHAYAMVDPVFQALVRRRQIDLMGVEDQFCTQCHSAIGTRGGECIEDFDFGGLSDIVMEGITCESCHKVAEVARDHNSGHVLDENGPIRGPISDPVESAFHASEPSDNHTDAVFCGACHDVIETSGLNLERPYAEWLESPAKDEGRNCQSCHMPSTTGFAAVGGPEREVHDHAFIGVDLPLLEDFMTEPEREVRKQRIQALLDTAATLEVRVPGQPVAGETVNVVVSVHNDIDAHNFPTGSTFNRQVWVELTATDALGNVLFRTGDLDGNGDLRDHWSELDQYGDQDLLSLSSRLVDENGNPTVFSWVATEHHTTAIAPLKDRTWTLFVPTQADTVGPITISSRLRFRALPPFLLRKLGLGDRVDMLPIYDVSTSELNVELN